ncbi:MAG: polyamine aminopropyltransferase [Candidatus Dactylopiibacterium sp.]|nr:polyamine aminopropyltransferase [Candidatus Dactylopiibacterium sp.]
MAGPARFCESIAPGLAWQVEGTLLAAGQSPHQRWEVWQTPAFGRLYRLDGRAMASEADSFLCHEPLIHIAGLALPQLRRALVLGGGDGASCAELLRYPELQEIVLAELDPAVVALAREHLPALHRGAFEDARVQVVLGDAARYVTGWLPADGTFDLVVFDLTDPDTAAAPLFEPAFLQACARLLGPHGALSLHLGSPHWQHDAIRTLSARLTRLFTHVTPVLTHVPLYGGAWTLAVASATLAPRRLSAARLEARLARLAGPPLRLIDPDQYHRLLACPPWQTGPA